MAHRVFPSGLAVASSHVDSIEFQDASRTPSDIVQVIQRGPGRWRGVLTLPSCGVNQRDRLLETRAFIVSLQGRLNTFDCPLEAGGMLASGTDLTLSSAITISGGLAVIEVSGATTGLFRGEMISVGGQAYILQSDMASGEMQCLPARIAGASGDAVEWEEPVSKARLTERGARNSRTTPSFHGPWILEWQSEV